MAHFCWYLGLALSACSRRQGLDCLNDEVPREVTAYEADHLMVVKSRYNLVVGRWVENFLHLLKERFTVELCRWNKGILSQKNVLTPKRCIEVFIEKVQGPFITSFKDDFDGVLQIDAHFIRLEIVLSSLAEAVLRPLLLAFQTEDAARWRRRRYRSSGACSLRLFTKVVCTAHSCWYLAFSHACS